MIIKRQIVKTEEIELKISKSLDLLNRIDKRQMKSTILYF